MKLRWKAITCDAQRLLTKSQMWGKLWHATVQAGGWVGVRSGREKHLPGKTPQTAPPSQDLNVVNAATKVDPRAMAEPGSLLSQTIRAHGLDSQSAPSRSQLPRRFRDAHAGSRFAPSGGRSRPLGARLTASP